MVRTTSSDCQRPRLTRLWAAPHGLSESELLTASGLDRSTLSLLLHAFDFHFVRLRGRLSFFHDHLRFAIERRYLPSTSDKQAAWIALATFFQNTEASAINAHSLPWLLSVGASRAEHWGELKNTLLDVDLLPHLAEASAHAWLHAFERTVGGKGKSGVKMLGAQRCNPQSKDFHVVALSFVQIPADPANLSEELKLRIEKLVKRERRRVPWPLELMRPLR